MKPNSLISLEAVAEEKTDADEPLIAKPYADLLRAEMRRRKIRVKDLNEQPELSKTANWRVLYARPGASAAAAERVRQAIMRLSPSESPIPPPFVAVRDPDHFLWCEVGPRLRKANPQLFEEFLELARHYADSRESAEHAEQEAFDRLMSLRNPSDDR